MVRIGVVQTMCALSHEVEIVVLLSSFNGEVFLAEQLSSISSQTQQVKIIARDDGSSDQTVNVLLSNKVALLESDENVGAKDSFAKLLGYAMAKTDADYFMFCDQDDVWYKDKVEKSLKKIQAMEAQYGSIPLLVHTDLEVVDSSLTTIAASMWSYEYTLPNKNSFSRLLVQNTITGCTVMINRKLGEKCLAIPGKAIMHDWWVGLVASYFGKIGYINEATIKYRQHGKNAIGAKRFKLSAARHLLGLCRGLIFGNNTCLEGLDVNMQQAKSFLDTFECELDGRTKRMLVEFSGLDKKNFLRRRLILLKYNLFKQGFIRNAELLFRI